MNHQPCNQRGTDYLRLSTEMSRARSLAFAELELANVALEDVIIKELRGEVERDRFLAIIAHLHKSQSGLTEMRERIAALRQNMTEHDFKDLPSLKTTDLAELGQDLSRARIVSSESWKTIASLMNEGGFYKVLELFMQETEMLMLETRGLRMAIVDTTAAANVGKLNLVLEENRSGNFKQEFARLYCAWAKFQQLFLASSMLSTDLWYRNCGVSSLLSPQVRESAA